MKKVIIGLLIGLLMSGGCYADYIAESDISPVETKEKIDLDNIMFLPITETVILRTMILYLDEENNVIRSSGGRKYVFANRDEELADDGETVLIPESTEFTQFCQSVGITKAKIITAAKTLLVARQ